MTEKLIPDIQLSRRSKWSSFRNHAPSFGIDLRHPPPALGIEQIDHHDGGNEDYQADDNAFGKEVVSSDEDSVVVDKDKEIYGYGGLDDDGVELQQDDAAGALSRQLCSDLIDKLAQIDVNDAVEQQQEESDDDAAVDSPGGIKRKLELIDTVKIVVSA